MFKRMLALQTMTSQPEVQILHRIYNMNRQETQVYRKFPKYSDTQKICCNHSKFWIMWLYHRVMSPNDADGMANSVDPGQTAPLGAVWSGSALFAQTCLSKNLGSLRYTFCGTPLNHLTTQVVKNKREFKTIVLKKYHLSNKLNS